MKTWRHWILRRASVAVWILGFCLVEVWCSRLALWRPDLFSRTDALLVLAIMIAISFPIGKLWKKQVEHPETWVFLVIVAIMGLAYLGVTASGHLKLQCYSIERDTAYEEDTRLENISGREINGAIEEPEKVVEKAVYDLFDNADYGYQYETVQCDEIKILLQEKNKIIAEFKVTAVAGEQMWQFETNSEDKKGDVIKTQELMLLVKHKSGVWRIEKIGQEIETVI